MGRPAHARPVRNNGNITLNFASPNNRDVIWLAERTSTRTGN